MYIIYAKSRFILILDMRHHVALFIAAEILAHGLAALCVSSVFSIEILINLSNATPRYITPWFPWESYESLPRDLKISSFLERQYRTSLFLSIIWTRMLSFTI